MAMLLGAPILPSLSSYLGFGVEKRSGKCSLAYCSQAWDQKMLACDSNDADRSTPMSDVAGKLTLAGFPTF